MELVNFSNLNANNPGQSSRSQLKKFAIILQQERRVNEFSTKIKNKFCFQTSFKNFKNLKELEI